MAKQKEEKTVDVLLLLKRIVPFIIPVCFFLVALFTLYDYGMTWDSPVHFTRGHAILHYFLTGKKDYSDLRDYCFGEDGFVSSVDYKTGEVCDRHRSVRRSEMQSFILDYNAYLGIGTYGHPPLSDIFLALSNYIFFIKLGWVEDLGSHHLYPIFATFILAMTVSFWTKRVVGIFGAIISALVVSLFPLLLGEQHFNVKDPIIASAYLLGIYLFWLSITQKSARIMYLSALAGAVSFGTKINYIFAPFVLLPWLLVYLGIPLWKERKKKWQLFFQLMPPRIIIAILLYPVIIFALFFATWPTLWIDPAKSIVSFFTYYKDIGTTVCPHTVLTPQWLFKCSNTMTILYIYYTVPIISLVLFLIGAIYTPKIWRKANYSVVLWLSFLFLTVLRVTLPGTAIYGGLRHIMEFIGPFAMIAGVGGSVLLKIAVHGINRFTKHKEDTFSVSLISGILIISLFIPIGLKMIALHPNQNVFYNSFIGGLKGAKERDFYGYGNTYGNSYYQAVQWFNAHAESGSKISFIWGLNSNISRSVMRPDITHLGVSRSGYNQRGEYLLTTLEYGNPVYGTFRYKYADRFLRPVYAEEVEGVALFKIWKNEEKYVKPGLNLKDEIEVEYTPAYVESPVQILQLKFEQPVYLKRIEYGFESEDCKLKSIGTTTYLSPDGTNLMRIPDEVNDFTVDEVVVSETNLTYLFAGDQSVGVQLVFPLEYPCDAEDIDISVYAFKQLYTTK
ncbi:MAG: hypothetical protein NUV98_00010 [Candidatus Roizmanbacteria bacterium]|nr:hypothetical protein [Candidatus Roizmanbacteria bacterium]